jgi:hypothetical protein
MAATRPRKIGDHEDEQDHIDRISAMTMSFDLGVGVLRELKSPRSQAHIAAGREQRTSASRSH